MSGKETRVFVSGRNLVIVNPGTSFDVPIFLSTELIVDRYLSPNLCSFHTHHNLNQKRIRHSSFSSNNIEAIQFSLTSLTHQEAYETSYGYLPILPLTHLLLSSRAVYCPSDKSLKIPLAPHKSRYNLPRPSADHNHHVGHQGKCTRRHT